MVTIDFHTFSAGLTFGLCIGFPTGAAALFVLGAYILPAISRRAAAKSAQTEK